METGRSVLLANDRYTSIVAEVDVDPAALAQRVEQANLPTVLGAELFRGYGVLGQAFASGHILAMRRAATTIGPTYTSVWHRDPDGAWTMWIDVEPVLGCPRYFGKELQDAVKTSIQISWPGPSRMTIRVPSGGLEWDIELGTTATVRLLTAVASRIPDRVWRQRPVLSTVAAIAGPMLRAGRITLHGTTPNGQWFKVYPRSIWRVTASRATLSGEDLGLTRPLEQPTMLADFRIPRRGFLVAGDAHFQPTTTSVTVSRLVRAATRVCR